MSSENERALVIDHRVQQSRYDYFLMAVAGSAIALSVQRTTGETLSWTMIPLGLAVFLWCFSFFAGCNRRTWSDAMTLKNFELLRVQGGHHRKAGNDPTLMQAGSDAFVEMIAQDNVKYQWWARVQFRTLIGGAGAYLVWHIWEMAIATNKSGEASEVIKNSLGAP